MQLARSLLKLLTSARNHLRMQLIRDEAENYNDSWLVVSMAGECIEMESFKAGTTAHCGCCDINQGWNAHCNCRTEEELQSCLPPPPSHDSDDDNSGSLPTNPSEPMKNIIIH